TAAAALSVASGSIKNAPISTGLNGEQTNPAVVGDAGDPIVIWTDTRNGPSDIYAQKLTPTMAPLWIPNGLPVCKATGGQVNPQAASDGAGGVIVVWEDHRTDAGDIYAQRINSLGLPVWASNGVPICTSVNAQRQPVIVSDETGGAVIAWLDDRNMSSDIYTQRINSAGGVQWAECGMPMCIELGDQKLPSACSDGAGGAVVAWQDARPTAAGFDIYAQRVEPSVGAFQWAPGGVAVCSATGDQVATAIAADPMGGSVVSWIDSRTAPNGTDVYVEHLDSNGASQWTANGVQVCDAAFDQTLAK